MTQKIRLGDLLVERGLISPAQLQQALARQRQTGQKLGKTLVELGFIDERRIASTLAQQLGLPMADLQRVRIRPEALRRLPEAMARRFRAIVTHASEQGVTLVMADPLDLFAYDEIQRHLKCAIDLQVAPESEILQLIDASYRQGGEIETLARSLSDELAENVVDLTSLGVGSDEDATVARLLNTIFEDALRAGASDVHLEPGEQSMRIRLRVDGMLQNLSETPRRVASALIQRLKLLANLDIAEKRLPQDGRFQARQSKTTVDVRLSILPTQHGESAVMRLLLPTAVRGLDELDMTAEVLQRFRELLDRPHGILLVTGPTGSGKTTTLYAALQALNTPERKILTVEDPVEYRLPGIVQVQVNERIGLDFARCLRAFLRQDPDVILVGEMRDEETVQIALRAALTGHLVLSTLHTNDAPGAAPRLLDMGASPYLLASALRGVLAQRLVRRVCDDCAQPHVPDANELAWLAGTLGDEGAKSGRWRHGTGCPRCHHTGYRGRMAVHELLVIDTELARLLHRGDSEAFRHAALERLQGATLAARAASLAAQGLITPAEAMRVTHTGEDL